MNELRGWGVIKVFPSFVAKATMRTYFILLIVIGLSASCEKSDFRPDDTLPDTSQEIRYLALGDSYTIGTSVSYPERFPSQLVDALRAVNVDYTFLAPSFIARNGWTTTQLQQALAGNDTLQPPYDLVSLLIGVNNQFQNAPFSRYEAEFPELLSEAVNLAGGDTSRVFVVSIPDYAFTPFGQNFGSPEMTSQEIDEYNNYNRQVAEEWGITYFNITPISRNGLERPELVASDGLHPSGQQYGRWVSDMLPVILSTL